MPYRPFICFVHVTKSGGNTFHRILNDNLARFLSVPYDEKVPHIEERHMSTLMRFCKWDGVGGHTVRGFYDYQSVVDREVFAITFLREPIRRYISFANYYIWHGWSSGIEDVLNDESFDNLQTKYFSISGDLGESSRRLTEDFGFVGIVEQYDASLLLLQQMLPDVFRAVLYEKANVAQQRGTEYYSARDLPSHLLARIKEKNELDLQLYELVKREFEQRKKAYDGNLDENLEIFKSRNLNFRRPWSKRLHNKLKNGICRKVFLPVLLKTKR